MFASAQVTQNKARIKAERGWMSLYLVLGTLCLGLWVSCLTSDRLQEPCAKHGALSSFILLLPPCHPRFEGLI